MDGCRALLAVGLSDLPAWTGNSWIWVTAVVALMVSLWCWLPDGSNHSPFRRGLACLSGLVGLICLWWAIPTLATASDQAVFWAFGALTISAAVATISARNPVYSAIWFAISLLGTAALFFLQNAQFLGIATVAVYAGAIVVTFLFVLMLSQPTGHAYYDRISWGRWPRLAVSAAAAILVGMMSLLISRTDTASLDARQLQMSSLQEALSGELTTLEVRSMRYEIDTQTGDRRALVSVRVAPAEMPALREQRQDLEQVALQSLQQMELQRPPRELRLSWEDLQTSNHMAQLGGRLFARQFVSIQAAGALLMAALVGAVAIASRDGSANRDETA